MGQERTRRPLKGSPPAPFALIAALLVNTAALAQPEAPAASNSPPPTTPAASAAPATGVPPEPTPVAPPSADIAASAPSAIVTQEQLAALQAQIDELKAKQEEAETNALLAEDTTTVEPDLFKVYGFMDMGIHRYWADPKSLVSTAFDTNALTFVTGNIDLYFDFNPAPDWRGLAEVRFTEAPLGRVESYGGVAGDFKRTETEQFDPHGTAPNAPMWGGYTVIERAYIEWNHFQAFRLMVGKFFTPFGIWNVDHGSPTLISASMPQFIQQKWMPIRQTGVQALGSFFVDDVEIAYRAWLSNGRTEENPFDYDDGKAFGARLFVRREGGTVNYQVGGSYHYGHVRDKVVNVTGTNPVSIETPTTWAYTEHVAGVDLSFDIADTRIRSEGMVRRTDYDEGKQHVSEGFSPGAIEPDRWQSSAYLTVAQQLPWFGLEPYIYGEVMQQPWVVADGLVSVSAGVNWRFTPATMLKVQGSRSMFFDWKYKTEGDPSVNDITLLMARLVVAF